VYAFFTMTMFAAIYYIMPRLTGREWASARLIALHFWTTALGIALYWVGLSWGGIGQGVLMNDPDVPFLDVAAYTVPYLWSRTVSGILLTIGHIVFAVLFVQMLAGRAAATAAGPTLFRHGPRAVEAGERVSA
jgi:cytochrome c oxidase cbb3-type subunit I